MGLVNSFINQIGREMGRDAYRSVANGKSKGQQIFLEPDYPLIDEVKRFELLPSEDQTFRELVNIVEKSENVDHKDFDWMDLFSEIDNKIEFCKSNLSAEYQDRLNALDEQNAQNFEAIKVKHLGYIDTVIQHYENTGQVLKKTKPITAFLASFLGVRSIVMGEKAVHKTLNVLVMVLLALTFYAGYVSFIDPVTNAGNLLTKTPEDLAKIQSTGKSLMGIAIFFYVLHIVLATVKIFRHQKLIAQNEEAKQKFVVYKAEIMR